MALDAFELAEQDFWKEQERIVRNEGYGSTAGARAIVQRYFEQAHEAVKAKLAQGEHRKQKHLKDFVAVIEPLDPKVIAIVALQGGLDAVASCGNLTRTLTKLGRYMEHEVWGQLFRNADLKLAARLERAAKRRNGSLKARRNAIRHMAKANGFTADKWPEALRLVAGQWLLEVLLETDAFVYVKAEEATNGKKESLVTLTEEALGVADAFVERMVLENPVRLPLTSPPPEWGTDLHIRIDCGERSYQVPLVRKEHCKVTKAHLKKALKDGTMRPVVDALNRIQRTPWRINERMLELIRWAYAEGPEGLGIPYRENHQIPGKRDDWEDLPEETKRALRRQKARIYTLNATLAGDRMILARDLAVADSLVESGNRFWTPYNFDWRGRVYTTCHFGFQRQDYVRSLFLFDEGKPLGRKGFKWLKVHLANCGDFGKVSKKSFEERIRWVEDNHDLIFTTGKDPESMVDWWKDADAPFQFVAACIEYVNALDWAHEHGSVWEYVCHLPVSFDGSCSGLQHLCAMIRAPEGSLVNLTPSEAPRDVYQVVADRVHEVVKTDASREDLTAKQCLLYGVSRSLLKRGVMTYAYSSQAFGMRNQLMADTMQPLADQVALGKVEAHPFQVPEDTYEAEDGQVYTSPGRTAAKYLGTLTFKAIEEIAQGPAEVMRFLRGIARALSHEGKPVIWHTPLGMPVVLSYNVQECERVSLYLQDRGIKMQVMPRLNFEKAEVDKRKAANAISPSFVHSLDGCHLQMVVNAAYDRGITSFALVHDSFGCLPGDAEEFRAIIREEFVNLYHHNDVLQNIRTEALSQIETNHDRIPELPPMGSLEITEVLGAEYAFA